MDIRRITDTYAVSPQIAPEDMAALAEAGFTTVIDNRPDAEVPPSHRTAAMQAAAEAAGLTFVAIPVTHQGLNADMVHDQADAIAASVGPVLAYCASGTRCTVIWALGNAQTLGADAVIGTALEAGYDISGLRPTLETLAQA